MKKHQFTPEQERVLKNFVDNPQRGGIKELSVEWGIPYNLIFNFIYRERKAREQNGVPVRKLAANAVYHVSNKAEATNNGNEVISGGPVLQGNIFSAPIKKFWFEENRIFIEFEV